MNPLPPRDRNQLRNDFGSVIREFRAPLTGFLRRYTGDEHVAADLAQETFVKAYFQLDRYDERRPLGPWLFTIAANGARDFLRRQAGRSTVSMDDNGETAAPAEHAPDRALLARERAEALEAAIAALPAGLREPILLHYQLDWPVAQIAGHLRIDEGAVKTRLHRARRRLQEMLNPEVSSQP